MFLYLYKNLKINCCYRRFINRQIMRLSCKNNFLPIIYHKYTSRYSSSDLKALITNPRQGVTRTQFSLCILMSIHGSFTAETKYKVKCTLVQALMLCTGLTAHRGSRGIALLFHGHGTRRAEGLASRSGLFYPGKDPVPIVQEAGWAPGRVRTGAENLALHRDSIPGPSRP